MVSVKYSDNYKVIRAAQCAGPGPSAIFDLEQLGADRWWRRILQRLVVWLARAAFWFFRTFWPIPHLGRVAAVSRAADVRYVLDHPQWFEAPYGLEMVELAGGENFMLGMEGADHDQQKVIVQEAMHGVGEKLFADLSRKYALRMIAASGGRIDVMKDLITRVASDACISYFGLKVDDPDGFAEWTMSLSSLLFADPFGDATKRSLALSGAERARAVIDRSIRVGRVNAAGTQETLLGRLLDAQERHPSLSDATIRSIMLGMATGLIPTNTVAAGNILDELLRRPDALNEAREAARAAEEHEKSGGSGANPYKQKLRAILLEAARLNPALFPGVWRYVREDAVIVSGSRTTRIPKGTALMVGTMSALRDPAAVKQPRKFNPDRKPSDAELLFGGGVHECIAKHLAMIQITEIFQVLLAQEGLHVASDRWGTMRRTGPFPTRLDMEFASGGPSATQEMLTICAPLKPESQKEQVQQLVEALQTDNDFKKALDATGIVHFASLNVIEAGDETESKPFLMLELNVDGTREEAIETIASHTHTQLAPIFDHTPLGGSRLAETLSRYALDLKTRPWGATGLNFNGTPEFSVADIRMQQRLALFARDAVGYFMERRAGIGGRAMPVVRFVRNLIRQDEQAAIAALDSELDWDSKANKAGLKELMASGAEFEKYLILPGRKRLLISDWVERTDEDALYHFLKSRDFSRPASPFVAFALLMSLSIYLWIGADVGFDWPIRLIISATGGLVAMIILALTLLVFFLLWLRWHERTDIPDDRDPTVAELKTVTARENQPGCAQNHFVAVTALKPGGFRKLTLALSLWGIKQLVRHAYRPGFVLNMGTIHYAKWFRLPKTRKLIFLANYDGSWESYLEDFVMKAHAGQTAAWSNGVGFPKTRLLIYEGAQDGDRFKRWVRRQQVATQFWYSRFPELTTDQIRNNAVIHQGLARANSDSMARSWLACFGSMQRPDHAIESSEVQSLVFWGFKNSPYAIYALLELPEKGRADWLWALLPGPVQQDGSRALKKEGTSVSFGENPFRPDVQKLGLGSSELASLQQMNLDPERLKNLVTFVGFSAAGLKKLGLSDNGRHGLASIPGAFRIGMANRGRILGDMQGPSQPNWRWTDAERADDTAGGERAPVADAILIIYGAELSDCRAVLGEHLRKLYPDKPDPRPLDQIESEPIDRNVFKEHFGFRDGISQPVIRGTPRTIDRAIERDIVEPGEFILGYRNNQGYYPPSIRVSIDTDLGDRLPDVIAESPRTFPAFRIPDAQSRDFGRNGAFLVARQIEQHVKRFTDFTVNEASRLATPGGRNTAGAKITDEWVAAKMMGRWRTGAPLVLRPVEERKGNPGNLEDNEEMRDSRWDTANDFAYAQDDPQGLRCPFGAHIRRANPRDGLKLGDNAQQAITNRHRLLRRGRTYGPPQEEGETAAERGLMFACICSDLERQFEFVQQTWIGSSSFHGLTGEVDPIIGTPVAPIIDSPDTKKKKGRFTIPTPSGPITVNGLESFVTVRAGGYFFMPSYSALQYLWELNREAEKPTV